MPNRFHASAATVTRKRARKTKSIRLFCTRAFCQSWSDSVTRSTHLPPALSSRDPPADFAQLNHYLSEGARTAGRARTRLEALACSSRTGSVTSADSLASITAMPKPKTGRGQEDERAAWQHRSQVDVFPQGYQPAASICVRPREADLKACPLRRCYFASASASR